MPVAQCLGRLCSAGSTELAQRWKTTATCHRCIGQRVTVGNLDPTHDTSEPQETTKVAVQVCLLAGMLQRALFLSLPNFDSSPMPRRQTYPKRTAKFWSWADSANDKLLFMVNPCRLTVCLWPETFAAIHKTIASPIRRQLSAAARLYDATCSGEQSTAHLCQEKFGPCF